MSVQTRNKNSADRDSFHLLLFNKTFFKEFEAYFEQIQDTNILHLYKEIAEFQRNKFTNSDEMKDAADKIVEMMTKTPLTVVAELKIDEVQKTI